MSEIKKPKLESPVHELIAARWSPYVFDSRPVSRQDLQGLFEAARWAASAFNDQPWRYILATSEDQDAHARVLSCLVEANQVWARRAPVLALSVVSRHYERNGKPNGTAVHDLGLATANLTLEAASRGLMVHQMGGILPDRAREIFAVPEGYDVMTGLAVGYPGEPQGELGRRDQAPRQRKDFADFVFGGSFGEAFRF